jgi:hypothetical protein
MKNFIFGIIRVLVMIIGFSLTYDEYRNMNLEKNTTHTFSNPNLPGFRSISHLVGKIYPNPTKLRSAGNLVESAVRVLTLKTT